MGSLNLRRMNNKTLEQEKAQIKVAERGAKAHWGVFDAETLVEDAPERGGRCSTVVLHMVRKIRPDVMVYHCDHGVHFPETRGYVKKMADEWDLNLYVEGPYRGGPSFWDIVEEHGFPKIRRAGSGAEATPCCYYLKDKPQVGFRKKYGIDTFIDGIRVAEARVRMFTVSDWGQFRYVTKNDLNAWKYSPIAFWTTEEVQECVDGRGSRVCGRLDDVRKRNLASQLDDFDVLDQLCVISHDRVFEGMTDWLVSLEKTSTGTRRVE